MREAVEVAVPERGQVTECPERLGGDPRDVAGLVDAPAADQVTELSRLVVDRPAHLVEERPADLSLDLAEERSAEVFAAALEAGFIINNPTPARIRLAPPLVLAEADAAAFLDAWPSILDKAGLS